MDFTLKRLFFCFFLIPSALYADNISLFFTGGPNSAKLSNKPFVAINDFVTNSYQSTNKNHWGGFWGGGIAHSFEQIVPSSHISFGFAGYSTQLGHVRGKEYPFINDGIYDALDYSFRVESSQFMFESRFSYVLYNWQPFVLAGIGEAWNRLKNYNEVAADPSSSAVAMNPGFSSNTHHNFAYELGVGIQHSLFEDQKRRIHYMASVGYRYFNLGKGNLGALPEQTTIDRLQIKNIYTQGIAFSIEASFN
jgi:opacity protein-like surface antigen